MKMLTHTPSLLYMKEHIVVSLIQSFIIFSGIYGFHSIITLPHMLNSPHSTDR